MAYDDEPRVLEVKDFDLRVAFRIFLDGSSDFDDKTLEAVVRDSLRDFALEMERVAVVDYNIDAIIKATANLKNP